MKLHFLLLSAVLVLMFSCKTEPNEEHPIPEPQEETPEALQASSFDFKLYGRWDKGDMIDKLYYEAVEKNKALKELDDQIKGLTYNINDTLESTLSYESVNSQYWQTASSYMAQIEDSILRTSAIDTFKELEDTYYDSMKKTLALADTIEQRKVTLNDRVLLMKLFVSESLLRRYQKNEFPEEEILQRTIKTYDELIDQTAPYTKLQD